MLWLSDGVPSYNDGSKKLNPTIPSAITTSDPDFNLDDNDTRLPIMPLFPTSNDSGRSSGSSMYSLDIRAAGSINCRNRPQSLALFVMSPLELFFVRGFALLLSAMVCKGLVHTG